MTPLIRPPRPEDQGYITSTWTKSMMSAARSGHAVRKHGADRGAPVAGNFRAQLATLGGRIDIVLDRPDTRALVAVWPEHGPSGRDFIVGWAIYVEAAGVPIIHYVYTRAHDDEGHPLRGTGIAGALFQQIGIGRTTPVICTSDGPSSEAMRGHFRASTYFPLDEFLTPRRTP